MSCAVKGCTNHFRKTNNMPGKRVQYFSFPKDIAIAAKWRNVCAKQNDSVIKGRICSIHFEPSCFTKSLQQQLLGYSPVRVRKLRSDAIPTLHLYNESSIVTNTPSLIAVKKLDTLYIDNIPEVVDTIVNATPTTSTATTDLCNRDDDVIQNLQWELAEMIKKLQKYEEKEKLDNDNHQQQLTTLKEQLSEYKQQQNREHEMYKTKMYEVLSKVFTPGQIRSLLNPSQKRATWSSEDIASAISLRSVSPRAYRYLRNVVKTPLPGLSTLRKWASNINTEPGIMNVVLDCMKVKGKSMQDFEKLVIITFDEVYLSNKIGIDRKIQKAIGPHKTCQCVMVQSLFVNLKQPIYYDYDKAMKKDTLETIISQLYDIGYTVVAIACDMGSSNMALWSELNIGVSPKNYYFFHPVDHNLKVFTFANVPHLLKLARNHLLDDGFTVRGLRIDKKCLQRIVDINAQDIKVSHSLTQYHLDVQATERQKVLPAVHVFSERVAKAIEWYGLKGYMENLDWTESARIIRIFNDWFDIFNASSMYGQHEGKNAYGIDVERQNSVLDEMNTLMTEIKIGKHKSFIAFQKGIIINNSSLREMLPYIQEKYSNSKFKITYILTRRLDQDVLENFFSFIRAIGGTYDQPTALDFKYRMKKYILGKHSTNLFCRTSNVTAKEPDLSCFVSPLASDSSAITSGMLEPYVLHDEPANFVEEELCTDEYNNVPVYDTYTFHPSLEENKLLKLLDEMDIVDTIEDEGLKYIAGYVAYRFKHKYNNLGVETAKMPIVANVDWIQFISHGKCMYPSDDLLKAARIMNVEFSKYHGSSLCTDKWIFNKLADIVTSQIQPIELPYDVILCLVRTRTYIRVREMNRQIIIQNKTKNKKLIKFTNNKT